MPDPARIYTIRVRTVLDKSGKVESAYYGKIYGDFKELRFSYFLNPTPNDQNIEFDPKQDLLPVKPLDQVRVP